MNDAENLVDQVILWAQNGTSEDYLCCHAFLDPGDESLIVGGNVKPGCRVYEKSWGWVWNVM